VGVDVSDAVTDVIPAVDSAVEPAPAAPRRARFVFLDLLRAVAAPLVFYSHVVRYWQGAGHSSSVVNVIDEYVQTPLHLRQDFGYFGVALFFLVSGFVVTYRASQERAGEFAVKRVLRIYPVLIAVVLFVALLGGPFHILSADQVPQISPFTVLTNGLLVNYVLLPQVVLVGVAWTLIIEVLFYLVLLVLLPLVKRMLWLAIVIELAVCWADVAFARDFGAHFFLLAISLSYLPVLLLGQICWAVWSKHVPLRLGVVFGLAAWLTFVWAGNRDMGRIDDGYGTGALIGLLLFVLLLLLEDKLRPSRVVSYLADRSYSIYLWHGVIALPLMGFLYPKLPIPLGIACGVIATMAAVELSFRGIERPSQRLARRLTRRRTT
jgi:peptidoglycan/LPS O-acetylase OafA/YrhL